MKPDIQSQNRTQRPQPQSRANGRRTGTWIQDDALTQAPAPLSASSPYSSGLLFKPDVLTGNRTYILAPFVYNGINSRKGVIGDGKKYTGVINGEQISYFNGRINLYSDANQNSRLESGDVLKGSISLKASQAKALNLRDQDGTWSAFGNQLSIMNSKGHLLLSTPIANGIF